MSHFSLARFLSISIPAKHSRVFTPQFATATATSPEKLYTLMQQNPTKFEKSLSLLKLPLDSTCVNQVLIRCAPTQSLMGIQFFVWAGLQSSYRHSLFMYSLACRLLSIEQNPDIVKDVIEVYKKEECAVSVKTMKVILNLCEKARLADEALWVLRKMPEFNLRPDTIMYNAVITLLCEKGDMVRADGLMKEMGLIDLYPSVNTYISMIRGFCNVGRIDDAYELLTTMRRLGCTPNVVVYSALVDGVCRVGCVERVLELLVEMEKVGGGCGANVVTYTSVIQLFCEKGMIAEAMGIFERMEAHGCAPNRVTLGILVKGHFAVGKVEEAYKLVEKMVLGGSLLPGDCYSCLMVELVRSKRLKEAEKILREMLANGMKPDGLSCSLIIKELCLLGHVLDGFCFYEEIGKIGTISSLDSDIHSMLLVRLCQGNHSAETARLARFMLENRIQLSASSVNKIIEHLNKSENKDLIAHLTRIGR